MDAPPAWLRVSARLVRRLPAGRFWAIHALSRRNCPRPFWARLAPELGGAWFACDLRDGIAREAFFTGRYEPQETAVVQRILRPGMTVVDVGANWGYFTLLAARRVGPAGRVVSLEPDPRLHDRLRANVAHNGLNNVSAHALAAAAGAGTLRLAGFDESGDNWGVSRLGDGPSGAAFDVAAEAVDGLLDELGIDEVDLLKMDIEGGESQAIRGMADGLKRHRYHRLLLELHPGLLAEQGVTVEDVCRPLGANGYRAWQIDHRPRAFRKAAYTRRVDPEDALRPVAAKIANDPWPHVLWVAPSQTKWDPE
jgi:FkbM family methyltransferase